MREFWRRPALINSGGLSLPEAAITKIPALVEIAAVYHETAAISGDRNVINI